SGIHRSTLALIMGASQQAAPRGERSSRSRVVGQWLMILAPPTAAFAQQQLAYGFVALACTKHAPVLVHLPLLLALAVTGFAAKRAWGDWHRSEEQSSV